MLRKYLLALLAVVSLFFSSAALALPFDVVTKAGTILPTQVQLGSTTTAYYTVTNNTVAQRNNNYVKHLPPNVAQVTSGGTYPNTCGATFNLAGVNKPGDSCTLQLTISGPANENDPPDMHLFVCFPGGKTCAGTPDPINIIQTFPVSIFITPVTARVDSLNTQQYTAIGTFADGNTINLTPLLNWISSNTAVATITNKGLATGTLGAGGTAIITANINGVTSNKATLTVAGVLTLKATPSVNTEVGAVYSQTNTAHGGFTPYTFSVVAGTLPVGTTLNAATGTVSGTPITAGTYNYTIQVADPDGKTATASTSVNIAASVTLTATPSPDTEVGIAYTQINTVAGGVAPYTYSVSAGTVPAGTTLNTTNGTVSGTPTTAGGFNYTIKVTDADGAIATATSAGNMTAVLALTATPAGDTMVGAAYSQANTVSGGTAPYTYTVIAGTLPAGTTLGLTGTVSGTPTVAGAFSYTIEVADIDGATATATSSGTIAATIALTATPSTLTEVSAPYSQLNTVSGGVAPFTYAVTVGTVPTGTTLNTATGTVSGTPTVAGAFSYTVKVTDADGNSTTAPSTGTIATAVALTATPSADTAVGAPYSQVNTVSGGTAPYTYAISVGTVPAGTSLNTATGTVSGTPTTAGAFSYTVKVTDADGITATATTTGTIAGQIGLVATPSPDTVVGATYTQLNTVSGGIPGYTYSISAGTVPAGTTLNTATGTVSGTATTVGPFSYTIQVTDSRGNIATAASSGTISATLTLVATPSTFTEVNVAYSQVNTVGGGVGPYTYSVSAGAVPAGTTLNTATGTVSGTPTVAGAFSYTIQVTDADGNIATAATTGTMATALTITATPSTFTEVGANYSQTNVASGGTGTYTYGISAGALPNGTTLNSATGTVSGTPTVAGGFNYTISVTDADGSVATAQTTGTMTAVLVLTATPSAATEVGANYSQTNVASGGTQPYSIYSLTAGALPNGTTLNTANGTVSGSPTTAGAFSYTISVSDADGTTATAPTSGTIAGALALTATASTQTSVGIPYSQTNVASGGKAPYTYTLSAGALPLGTTLSATTGTVSGSPTTVGPFNYTIEVTDSNGVTATAATSGTIQSLGLTATPAVNTEVGVAYSQTNVASGGTAPYTYTVSAGTIPAGTTLSATTGTVSGTPTTAGAFNYTITVTDSVNATATASTSGTITAVLALTATPSTATEVGATYSQANTVSGGTAPYSYTLSAGALPNGTTLNGTTGLVSGTPTTAGPFSYTIRVTDHDGAFATAASSGTIANALALTATPSAVTVVGAAYSQTNVGSGGATPYTYSLSAGALPAGTTLNPATGTVSGAPTTSGPINYTITVTDNAGVTATAATSGTITPAAGTPTLTATPSAVTEVGAAYSQVNTVSGGTAPYTYAVSAGAVPGGTNLNTTTGTVSGTPTTPGGFSYTIQVTDNLGHTATAPTSGTMTAALVITATPSTNQEIGAAYSQTNVASGGTTPYSAYSVSAGTVPAGTTLNTTSGTVSGTPTTAGAYSYTISITDHNGVTATAPTSGTITATVALAATPSTVTEVGAAYSQVNTVSGGVAPYTYSVSLGAVPAGTTLNPATGTVSGTPTAGGPFSYTIQVTDNDGKTATAATSGTMLALAIVATPSTFTEVGAVYSQTNVASGGTVPYVYSLGSGTLPNGTSLSATTGTVSGTPTTAGAFSYTIKVTDNVGATATAATSGTVTTALALAATPSGETSVGVAYSQVNTVSGGTAPYVYSVSAGTVPAGTTLNTTTGTVSGTPSTAGAFSYTIQVKDHDNVTASAASSGTIASLGLTATPSTFTEVNVNYSQTNAASGGTAPYTYTLNSGNLPNGTTLSSTTGTVSGTPTNSGGFSYTIKVTDSVNATATAPTSGTIASQLGLSSNPSAATAVGANYSQTNVGTNGTTPYTYSLTAGAIPNGTTLSATTGTVSGVPTAAGAISYTITVTDQDGATASQPTTATIAGALALTATPSTVTEVGAAYSQTNAGSGGATPYTYAVSAGAVPAGTTLSATTGTVSGTPTTSGAISYTIMVTDHNGTIATAPTSGTLTARPTLAATPSAVTATNQPYSQVNTVSGGTAPYTYAITTGFAPAGTAISPSTGTVAGTPTTVGAFSYTVTVTDNNGVTGTAASSGTITAGLMLKAASPKDTGTNNSKPLTSASKSAVEYTFNGTTGDTVSHIRLCLATDATCENCSNSLDVPTSIVMGSPYYVSADMLTHYLMKYTSALSSQGKPDSTYYIGVYASSSGANCTTADGAGAYCGTSNTGLKNPAHMCIAAHSKNGASVTSVSNNGSDVYLTKAAHYLYASNQADDSILQCVPNANGTFSNCAAVASITSPYTTAFTKVNGTQYGYVTSGDGNVYQCALSQDGANAFTCHALPHGQLTPLSPQAIAFLTLNDSQFVYLGNSNGNVYQCPVSNDGSFGECSTTIMTNGANAIALQAQNGMQYIYGVNSNGSIEKCTVNVTDGALSSCAIQTGPAGTPASIAFENSNGAPFAYVTSNSSAGNIVYYAGLDKNGNLSQWTSTSNPIEAAALSGISFTTVNNILHANVSAQDGTIYQCEVNRTTGNLGSCELSSTINAKLASTVTAGDALADIDLKK
jgi:hypothetical protein